MANVMIWKERKRTLFGLPLSFTQYRLTNEKLYVITGLFTTREEEVRLYRVMDMTLRRTLEEKMFGLGTLHLCTADKSTPEIDLKRIKNSAAVRDLLSQAVEEARADKGITGREWLGEEDHDDV